MIRKVSKSEDNRMEMRLESDPRFLLRIEQARQSVRSGRAIKLEDLDIELSAGHSVRRP